MPIGLSLHIGLNKIDKGVYGDEAPLLNCHNDAYAMRRVADFHHFEPIDTLLDERATYEHVAVAVRKAATRLQPGDFFMLTYAGHGSQVPSVEESDDEDRRDETWVLFDRMMIDNEIFALLRDFARGVRVVLISDSCHSGTVARNLHALSAEQPAFTALASPVIGSRSLDVAKLLKAKPRDASRFRVLPESARTTYLANHAKQVRARQRALPRASGSLDEVRANVILLAACQDHQVSADGEGSNGYFTENLLKVWASGSFSGNYHQLKRDVSTSMKTPMQVPNLLYFGPQATDFVSEVPFSIGNGASPQKYFEGVSEDMTTKDRFLMEAVAAAVATKVVEKVVDHLTRSQGRGIRSFDTPSVPQSRDWGDVLERLAEKAVEKAIDKIFRERQIELPKGIGRSWTNEMDTDRDLDSFLEKTVEKLVEKVLEKI